MGEARGRLWGWRHCVGGSGLHEGGVRGSHGSGGAVEELLGEGLFELGEKRGAVRGCTRSVLPTNLSPILPHSLPHIYPHCAPPPAPQIPYIHLLPNSYPSPARQGCDCGGHRGGPAPAPRPVSPSVQGGGPARPGAAPPLGMGRGGASEGQVGQSLWGSYGVPIGQVHGRYGAVRGYLWSCYGADTGHLWGKYRAAIGYPQGSKGISMRQV